jgi:hypothetical protein
MNYEKELKELVQLCQDVRLSQREYFTRSAIAKKTKTPLDLQAAKSRLLLSKELEKKLDEKVEWISTTLSQLHK